MGEPLLDKMIGQGRDISKLNASGELTFEYVNKNITVTNGKTRIFKDKKLVFGAKITLVDMAVLIFENCDISVEEIPGEIISCCGEAGKCLVVSFINCTIHHKRKSAYFIKNTSSICYSDCIFVRFIGCDFDTSQNIVDIYANYTRIGSNSGRLSIERSKINIDIDRESALFRCNTLEFVDSLFFIKEKEEKAFVEKRCFCYAHKMKILNCQFMNLLFEVPKHCKCVLEANEFKQCNVVIEGLIESCLAYDQKNEIVFAPEKPEKLVSIERKQMYVKEYSITNHNVLCRRSDKLIFRNELIVKIINVGGCITMGMPYSFVELSINNQSVTKINLDTYYGGFWIDGERFEFDTNYFIGGKGSASRVIAPGKKVKVKFGAYSGVDWYFDDCTIEMAFGDVMIVVKDANTSWWYGSA